MKKGQAAMEFLMTYGWAILVVIAAIAALAYFGILSPGKMLPERCVGESGMDCLQKPNVDASANTISFVIKNNLGSDINITNITKESGDCTVSSYTIKNTRTGTTSSSSIVLDNGDSAIVTVSCSEDLSGRTKATFLMNYHDTSTGFEQKTTYEITGNAK